MINWFGPDSWDAPICRDCPRCDIPVGDLCGYCGLRIRQNDNGVTMPYLGVEGETRSVMAFHLSCHLKSVLPHKMWASHGLIPTRADGLDEQGKFRCATCGVAWSEDTGWTVA